VGKTQRVIGFLLVVAALGLAAYAWMLSKEMVPDKPSMYSVVVAAERIAAGSMLTADKLRLMEFPERPVGSYAEISRVAGMTTPVDIASGEALLAERLAPPVAVASFQQLADDERAVAIRVDEVIAVGNRLSPGDRVDVFASFRRNSDEIADSQARLLLSGLRILAFGSQEAPDPGKKAGAKGVAETPRTAVLAVPLADVDKLALAAEAGRLLLALRPKRAEEVHPSGDAQAVSLRELTSVRPSKQAEPVAGGRPAQTGVSVRVMHGLKETSVHFNSKNTGTGQ